MLEMVIRHLAVFLLAYLLGAFPTGYLIVRAFTGADVRKVGSGRTGGTNVLRSSGWLPAALTVLGDGLKGGLAVLLARAIGGTPWALAIAGIAVVAGHNYSVFLGWDGGAGTITNIGVALFINPAAGVTAIAIGVPVLVLWRYASLASIAVAVAVPLIFAAGAHWGGWPWAYCLYAGVAGLLSVFELRPNIVRLIQGTERKVGQPIKSSAAPMRK